MFPNKYITKKATEALQAEIGWEYVQQVNELKGVSAVASEKCFHNI